MYVCIYVCMYLCMYLCIYVCIYVSMYLCMYLCIYVSMYVSMRMCVCMHRQWRQWNVPLTTYTESIVMLLASEERAEYRGYSYTRPVASRSRGKSRQAFGEEARTKWPFCHLLTWRGSSNGSQISTLQLAARNCTYFIRHNYYHKANSCCCKPSCARGQRQRHTWPRRQLPGAARNALNSRWVAINSPMRVGWIQLSKGV